MITTDERGLFMERIFDAPRELVWRERTEPELFARWYGPLGFTIPACEIDFRVGGRIRNACGVLSSSSCSNGLR